MNLKIKRIDKSLPLPEYKTKGAAALDLCARVTVKIKPGEVYYIPLNIVTEVPKDSWVLLAPRSSTHKLGIIAVNGVGVVDSDFCGDNDEYLFPAYNFTDKEVIIERGTRIAQIIPLRYTPVVVEEVDSFDNRSRGGIGSTGRK